MSDPDRIVDRTRLAIPKLHSDIRREDRIRVLELVLKGEGFAAYQLADSLEEGRLRAERQRARDVEHQRHIEAIQVTVKRRQELKRREQRRRESSNSDKAA